MKLKFAGFLSLMTIATACSAANEGVDAAKLNAENRYHDDQKICADEANSAQRMQCMRDAKEEYTKALNAAEAKATTPNSNAASCTDCGRVTAVRISEKEGQGSAVGMIAGGVAGALLGHQVGAGRGKDVATFAGAAGGAYAGNKIEGNMKSTKTWAVTVKFDNGSERTFHFASDPGYAAGDPVKSSGSGIIRR